MGPYPFNGSDVIRYNSVLHCSYCSKSVETPPDQPIVYHICGHVIARLEASVYSPTD